MKITNQDKHSESYRKYVSLLKDGWYIQHTPYNNGINTFAIAKDMHDTTRGYVLLREYIAYDVMLAFKKEFGFKVRKKNISNALNFNPLEHVPKAGCKMTFYEHFL